jgi:hypothetical protein
MFERLSKQAGGLHPTERHIIQTRATIFSHVGLDVVGDFFHDSTAQVWVIYNAFTVLEIT